MPRFRLLQPGQLSLALCLGTFLFVQGCGYDFDAPFAGSQDAGFSDASTDRSSPPDGATDGPSETDSTSSNCDADECSIGGECILAGTPKQDNHCLVCLPATSKKSWSQDQSNPTCDSHSALYGAGHSLPRTPYGHEVAVACAKCVDDDLQSSLAKIESAKSQGADVIEFGVSSGDGELLAGKAKSGVYLADVLDMGTPCEGGRLLSLDLSSSNLTAVDLVTLLDDVRDSGCGEEGGLVIIRSPIEKIEHLLLLRHLLALDEYVDLRGAIRLYVSFGADTGDPIADLHHTLNGIQNAGLHGVVFSPRMANLFSALNYAKSLHLGTAISPILGTETGAVLTAALREEADMLYVRSQLAVARKLVRLNNGQVYLNVWQRDPSHSNGFVWYGTDETDKHTAQLHAGSPTLETDGIGHGLYGTSLHFDAAKEQSLTLYAPPSTTVPGVLVAAVVRFDLEVNANSPPVQYQTIVTKADSHYYSSGEFDLSLQGTNTNNGKARLEFTVNVADTLEHARYEFFDDATNTPRIDKAQSYLVVGAYDGSNPVHLWLNGSNLHSEPSASTSGKMKRNSLPITLGAVPSDGSSKYHFEGNIQMLTVQTWSHEYLSTSAGS